MEPDLQESWTAVCNYIKDVQNVDAKQVDAFFARLHPEAMSEGYLMLTADSGFIKKWIERNYLPAIEEALKTLHGIDFVVEIEVDEESVRAAQPKTITVEYVAPAGSAPQPQGSAQVQNGYQTQQAQGSMAPAAGNAPQASAMTGNEYTAQAGQMQTAQTQAGQGQPMMQSNGNDPAMTGGYLGGGQFAVQPSSIQPNQVAAVYDASQPQQYTGIQPAGMMQSAEAAQSQNSQDAGGRGSKDGLVSALTFANYVIGDSNRLAYSMAVAVAEAPGKPNLNPLFIYGKSGLGKTHLLRAIQNYVLETRPGAKVIYTDSAEFLSEYATASAEHDKNKTSFQNFQSRYANADVLLIDDVQYFTGKTATLDMVFQLFNKFTSQGKQIVLSADRAPKNIDIDERYKSRFNQGGTFDIQPPEVETKLAIIKSFIEEYKHSENVYDLYIPEDIQLYIAEISSSNIRELKSAVTKVIYQIQYFNNPNMTLTDVKNLLENHFSSGISKRLTAEIIQGEVERYYKISHADLIGPKRSRNIMYARQVAIYLCRNMLDIPYNDIGKKFNRDHSTVMYSVQQVENKLKESRDLQEEIENLTKLIRES